MSQGKQIDVEGNGNQSGAPMAQGLSLTPLTPLRASFLAGFFALVISLLGLTSLPPLDRDEARFAQATAQMLEAGDLVSIHFQEEERNKKPIGIHWLQAASVSTFSSSEARAIWAYRLPSVLAAIIAAFSTAYLGARIFGATAGLFAGLFLATAPVFAGEATIAKTDASLLAVIVGAQALLYILYDNAERRRPSSHGLATLFWVLMAAGILLKGPIAPLIAFFTIAGVLLRDAPINWRQHLQPVRGLIIMTALVVPWLIAVSLATDGRFLTDAVGGDMAAKITMAKERHGGPPGFHLAALPLLLWPAIALVPIGLVVAFRERARWQMIFLLAWIVPTWIIFELTATKLPHYTLPLLPALAILSAGAIFSENQTFPRWATRTGIALYSVAGALFAGVVAFLPFYFEQQSITGFALTASFVIAATTFGAAYLFARGERRIGGAIAIGASAFLAFGLLEGILPKLERLQISQQIASVVRESGHHAIDDGAPPTILAGYYEPSAIFLLGTRTKLTDGAEAARQGAGAPGSAIAVEAREMEGFLEAVNEQGLDLQKLGEVEGLNYSNGKDMKLVIYAVR